MTNNRSTDCSVLYVNVIFYIKCYCTLFGTENLYVYKEPDTRLTIFNQCILISLVTCVIKHYDNENYTTAINFQNKTVSKNDN